MKRLLIALVGLALAVFVVAYAAPAYAAPNEEQQFDVSFNIQAAIATAAYIDTGLANEVATCYVDASPSSSADDKKLSTAKVLTTAPDQPDHPVVVTALAKMACGEQATKQHRMKSNTSGDGAVLQV